jgi:hypothetical protein
MRQIAPWLAGLLMVLVLGYVTVRAQNRSTTKGSEFEVIETPGACVYVVHGTGMAAVPKALLQPGGGC